ncbi:hypothetical protein ACU4GD_04205 [Cupriavidus basilensis]
MTLAGAGVVVAAGARLSTLCGNAQRPSALCVELGNFMQPAWLAVAALLLAALGCFGLRRTSPLAWQLANPPGFAIPDTKAQDDIFDSQPPATGGEPACRYGGAAASRAA